MDAIRFLHFSDSHIGPSPEFSIRGVKTHDRARAMVDVINARADEVDFVVHTGDVVADPDRRSSAAAREIFSGLRSPTFFIPGNHDEPKATRELITDASVEWHPVEADRVVYTFELSGHTFLALDAIPSEPFWGARVPADQIKLAAEVAVRSKSLTIFIHYPTLPVGVRWIDQKMLLWNGRELHEALCAAPPGVVRGVFCGHVHRPFSVIEDGILYSSVASSFEQFVTFPEQAEPDFAVGEQPGYAIVQIGERGAAVCHHRWS